MTTAYRTRELKHDFLGRIERIEYDDGSATRRLACGSAIPGSRIVARLLLERERRALRAAHDLRGIPALIDDPELAGHPSLDGWVPRPDQVLVRSWLPGEALHLTHTLPADFFDRLAELVGELHRRSVCHNDLHKEQNILVGEDGYPCLIDFQLATVHHWRSPLFRACTRDDLRHVAKHRRRYARRGRRDGNSLHRTGRLPRRSTFAFLWRKLAKPVYNLVTRRLLHYADAELRRPSSGPWPKVTAAIGPWPDDAFRRAAPSPSPQPRSAEIHP